MAFKLLGYNNRKLELRKRNLTDNADGGAYHVVELAYIEEIDNDEYVHSVGLSARFDEVTDDVRSLQKAEDIKRKQRQDARDLAEADVVRQTA